MKYIVYKTTCLVNSKIYIGYHQTSNPEVFDGYLGCGLYKQCNGFRWTRTDSPTETINISH